MRRVVKGFSFTVILLACALSAWLVCALHAAPVFTGGYGYELYCGTSSAEIIRTDAPAAVKLVRFDIRGESVRYEGDRFAELQKEFSAEVRFTERAGGVVNYYLYSPKLKSGVVLEGREINLHIAVSETQTAVGTPLIFGGF